MSLRGFSLCFLSCILVSCTAPTAVKPTDLTGIPAGPSDLVERAKSAQVTIASDAVRRALSAAGENFTVTLHGGNASFSHPERTSPFTGVRIESSPIVQAGSGVIAILTIESNQNPPYREVAVFSASGSSIFHRQSFVLGRATVESLWLQKEMIHVQARHTLPGDLGERTTEFVFSMKF